MAVRSARFGHQIQDQTTLWRRQFPRQNLSKFVNPNYLSTKMPVDLEDGRIWGSRQCFVNIFSSLIFPVLHFGLCFYFSNCVFGLQNCRKLCEAIRWMRWPDFPCLKEQQEGWCWRAVFDVPFRLLQCIDCHRASRGFKCMELRITKEMWLTSNYKNYKGWGLHVFVRLSSWFEKPVLLHFNYQDLH